MMQPVLDPVWELFADDERPQIPINWWEPIPGACNPPQFKLRDMTQPGLTFSVDFIRAHTNEVVYRKTTLVTGFDDETSPNIVVAFVAGELEAKTELRGEFLMRVRVKNTVDNTDESMSNSNLPKVRIKTPPVVVP